MIKNNYLFLYIPIAEQTLKKKLIYSLDKNIVKDLDGTLAINKERLSKVCK